MIKTATIYFQFQTMFKVVSGVEYMHKIGMYHRDLKPENILLMTDSDHARVKLIDFGGACLTSDEYEMALLVGSYRWETL